MPGIMPRISCAVWAAILIPNFVFFFVDNRATTCSHHCFSGGFCCPQSNRREKAATVWAPRVSVRSISRKKAVSHTQQAFLQKGGTTNLRGNLLTHPMVWGKRQEVHFFDRLPSMYPQVGQWEGEGLDMDIGIGAAGLILSEYAKACVSKAVVPSQHMAGMFPVDQVFVDSSPKYIFSPLAPYRIKMVRPGAKFVVVLRDPTDRYFSHLRMDMCRTNPHKDFISMKEFHPPGWAREYLARADVGYKPYTALCRGENASASDLWKCSKALEVFHPLFRGLYADQLERWYRVFDRSQIMIIDSSEMFSDFTAVVGAVAEFAGLPEYSFTYDPSHEFKGDCSDRSHGEGIDYFEHGGRYDRMVEEEDLFREWYRPHNERLYKLLGRDFMWRQLSRRVDERVLQ